MTYKITLRTLDWDCYTSWESFRMRNLIEEMGVKFRRRRVSRKDEKNSGKPRRIGKV